MSKPSKRTSRGLRRNVIPPAPLHLISGHAQNRPLFGKWVAKTYAVGTPVRLLKPVEFFASGPGKKVQDRVFPPGTVARVRKLYPVDASVGLELDVATPLFVTATTERWWADVEYEVAHETLEPLDDNWGPQTIPMKRPWKGRFTAPNGYRRISLEANATCPGCGSPHYFEGPFHRDCAEPSCRYYRGGTAKHPHFQSESVVVKPLGSRRLGFTSETVHPSAPDVYPEIENDALDDIVIEADDLDEDETFAARAAKIIAEELGHVEGSDGRGPSRWYTQSDPNEDYRTGSHTRKSIHIDDNEWSSEEQQEIYDELKRRRLVY